MTPSGLAPDTYRRGEPDRDRGSRSVFFISSHSHPVSSHLIVISNHRHHHFPNRADRRLDSRRASIQSPALPRSVAGFSGSSVGCGVLRCGEETGAAVLQEY